MQPPDPIVVTDALRSAAERVTQTIGAEGLVIEPGWELFASAVCPDLIADAHGTGRVVVVGPTEAVVGFAGESATDEFGFVTPVAESARWWQRLDGWRVEATMQLWGAGWSTLDVDRIQVPSHQTTIEFAIGNARPTD